MINAVLFDQVSIHEIISLTVMAENSSELLSRDSSPAHGTLSFFSLLSVRRQAIINGISSLQCHLRDF